VLSRLHHISLPQSVDCLYKRLLTVSGPDRAMSPACVCLSVSLCRCPYYNFELDDSRPTDIDKAYLWSLES